MFTLRVSSIPLAPMRHLPSLTSTSVDDMYAPAFPFRGQLSTCLCVASHILHTNFPLPLSVLYLEFSIIKAHDALSRAPNRIMHSPTNSIPTPPRRQPNTPLPRPFPVALAPRWSIARSIPPVRSLHHASLARLGVWISS